jgi:hypothetical protein
MSEHKNEDKNKFYIIEVYETIRRRVMVEAKNRDEAYERFSNIDEAYTDDSYFDGELDYEIGWIHNESELCEEEKNKLKTSKEGWRYLC